MITLVKEMFALFEANYYDVFLYVVIMVSAIITLIGILKPLLYNRIKSKLLRKFVLAFSNVAFSFVATLVAFLIEHWNMHYYVAAAVALTICTIITYWLYENTCLRNLIATIGNIVLKKVANVALISVTADDIKEVKSEVDKAAAELKAHTAAEIKRTAKEIKEDNDLKGL